MPRVLLDPKKHEKDVRDLIRIRIRDSELNQTQIAREMSLSQASFSRRLSDMNFTWRQLVTICNLLGFSDSDRLKVMK